MKQKTLFVVTVSAMVMLSLALFSCATAPPSTSEKQQQQDEIRSMANASLSQVYAKYPEAKSEISIPNIYQRICETGHQ